MSVLGTPQSGLQPELPARPTDEKQATALIDSLLTKSRDGGLTTAEVTSLEDKLKSLEPQLELQRRQQARDVLLSKSQQPKTQVEFKGTPASLQSEQSDPLEQQVRDHYWILINAYTCSSRLNFSTALNYCLQLLNSYSSGPIPLQCLTDVSYVLLLYSNHTLKDESERGKYFPDLQRLDSLIARHPASNPHEVTLVTFVSCLSAVTANNRSSECDSIVFNRLQRAHEHIKTLVKAASSYELHHSHYLLANAWGKKLFQEQDFDGAAKIYDNFATVLINSGVAQFFLGEEHIAITEQLAKIYKEQGKPEAAIEMYVELLGKILGFVKYCTAEELLIYKEKLFATLKELFELKDFDGKNQQIAVALLDCTALWEASGTTSSEHAKYITTLSAGAGCLLEQKSNEPSFDNYSLFTGSKISSKTSFYTSFNRDEKQRDIFSQFSASINTPY